MNQISACNFIGFFVEIQPTLIRYRVDIGDKNSAISQKLIDSALVCWDVRLLVRICGFCPRNLKPCIP